MPTSPIRPLLVTVMLTVVGCVLPEYERPASKAQAIQDPPAAGGAESKGGSSSSQTGAETPGTGGASSRGGSATGGSVNLIGSGGTLFASAGTTGVNVNMPSTGGTMPAGGVGMNSGGLTSIAVGTGGGGALIASCGGVAGAGGECDCGTGGTSTCPTGYADCLGSGQCDVELARNVDHCGACGKRCDSLAPDSTTKWDCISGICIVGQCREGYADCDGLVSNGCETDTRVDAKHCGGCLNSACKYPICAKGVCVSTFTAGRSDVPSNPSAVADAELATLSTNTIWVWQTSLQSNNDVIAFGAITNLKGLLFPGTFRMALYDDLNGMPNAPVLAMPPGVALTANDGMQEFILSAPFRVQAPGLYWVAVWASDSNAIKIVRYNIKQRDEVLLFGTELPFALGQWPSGTTFTSKLTPVAPAQGFVGFFPHMYARYVYGTAPVGL